MNKAVIIGGGFGGLTAAKKLCKFKRNLEVTLIDKSKESHFLPALPDIIGKRISAQFLKCNIGDLAKRWGFTFINEEVFSIDLEKREILTPNKTLPYDYLIIASGSQTNFYDNERVEKQAYRLDNAFDAIKIIQALEEGDFDNYVVCGGGYTGVEIATNLWRNLNKKVTGKRIIISEIAPSILGSLPEWMKDYVRDNLGKLNIEIFPNTSVDKIEDGKIFFSGGQIVNNAMLVWAAGVKVPSLLSNLAVGKGRQGRFVVDEYLRLNSNCFVIGDCAQFQHRGSFLRMAVQFSIAQGCCAASNIIRDIKGVKLKKYKPIDLGYIIPMANNKSCGKILGVNMRGFLPTIFHYLMCAYRSWRLKDKIGIIGNLIRGGVR